MPRPRAWKPFILVASYVFYARRDLRFCFAARARSRSPTRLAGGLDPPQRRRAAAQQVDRWPRRSPSTSACSAVFKYYGFFAQDVGDVLDAVGLGLPLPLLSLALPVGVSFFTFQAISYIVDVRRGLIEPARAARLRDLPHLLPAPRGRADRARARVPAAAGDAARPAPTSPSAPAVSLIALGLVKKVAIADYLARTVVDPVFAVPQAYSAPDVAARRLRLRRADLLRLLGLHGHRDRPGAAHGLRLPAELRPPVPLAISLREFWRRWHITLSRYLRDFLYIPLGGNRRARRGSYAQPDDHDDPRRPVARRGVDVRAVGRDARRVRCAVEHASASGGVARCRGGVRWLVAFHFVVLALDPLPRARTSRRSGSSCRGSPSRARRRCGASRSSRLVRRR